MPFGLKDAPATLQCVMYIIHLSVKWQVALDHLDDLVNFSQPLREDINCAILSLSLLEEAAFKLKLKTCAFIANNIDYLFHVIRLGRPEVNNHTTYAIRALKISTTQTESRSCIGLRNICDQLVPTFARIASLLTARLRKSEEKSLNNSVKERWPLCRLDFTGESYLSFNFGPTQDWRTIHPRHRCMWPPSRVWAVSKERRQCL